MKFPEQFRWKNAPAGYYTNEGERFGVFIIPPRNANGRTLKIIACDGNVIEWDHVSVSLADFPKKCPSWDEMCIVKKLFWEDTECVVQFHPPETSYVNTHLGCLHLWRFDGNMPMPPMICV